MESKLTLAPCGSKRLGSAGVALLLLALLGLALGLRLLGVQHSLWLDELHTGWVVRGPWEQLPRRAALGNHGPLYFAVVKCLLAMGIPTTEWGLRSVSVLSGALVVGGTFLVLRAWGVPLALAAAATWAAAVDPQLLWFAQEARPYALLQAMSLAHVWLGWRLFQARRRTGRWWLTWGVWVALGAALLVTHLVAGQVLAAQGLALATLWLGRWPRASRTADGTASPQQPGWLFLGLALSLLLAWGSWPLAWHVWHHRQLWLGVFPPWQQVLGRMIRANVPLATALVAGGMVAVLVWRRGNSRPESRPARTDEPAALWSRHRLAATVFATWWLVAGPAGALAFQWLGVAEAFFPRYLTPAHAALALAWGCWAAWLPGNWPRRTAALALVLGTLVTWPTLPNLWQHGVAVKHASEDWRQALATLRRHARPGAPLLLAPGLVEERLVRTGSASPELQAYLLYPVRSIYDPGPVAPWLLPQGRTEAVPPEFWARFGQQGRAFLLVRGSPQRVHRLGQSVAEEAARQGIPLRNKRVFLFRGVGLWRLEAATSSRVR